MTLTDSDRRVLAHIIGHRETHEVLEKFATARRQAMEANCADAMRSVPRASEVAADYAAKAEAYKTLLVDLETFADQN